MSDKLEVSVNLQPAVGQLRTVVEGLSRSKNAAAANEIAAKEMVLAHFQPIFSPENIGTITEEEFKCACLLENRLVRCLRDRTVFRDHSQGVDILGEVSRDCLVVVNGQRARTVPVQPGSLQPVKVQPGSTVSIVSRTSVP